MNEQEYLITDVKAAWQGEIIECSLLVQGDTVRFGKEVPLQSHPSQSERVVINGNGSLVMPMIKDQLSFISRNIVDADLRRLKLKMHMGGVKTGVLLLEEEVTRIKWLDVARAIRRTMGSGWTFAGNDAHIRRWAQVEQELPDLLSLDAVQALKIRGDKRIAVCEGQEHRRQSHRHAFTPFLYSLAMTNLVLEEQKPNETLQETINRMNNEIDEIEGLQMVEKVGAPYLGATFAHSYAMTGYFLPSLVLDSKSRLQPNLIPRRSSTMRYHLLKNISRQRRLRICVGNNNERDREINLGYEVGDHALPILIEALKPFASWIRISELLGGHDNSSDFVLLSKGKKQDIFDGMEIRFQVDYAFSGGNILFER